MAYDMTSVAVSKSQLMKSFSEAAKYALQKVVDDTKPMLSHKDGVPYYTPSKPVSYTFTYASSNTVPFLTQMFPTPPFKSPLSALDVKSNLIWDEKLEARIEALNEDKVQEPLFETPDPPAGYRVERKSCTTGLWCIVTRLFGRDPLTGRWVTRKLPSYYIRLSAALKTMARLKELNPEYVYRVSEYYKPKGQSADGTWAKPIKSFSGYIGQSDFN